jgi:2-oxoisovalerate ferredoxin oxidoreductase delta subunit
MTVRPLWADIPSSVQATGTWRTFRPVIDLSKCTKCNVCWKFCPDVAIHFDGGGFPVIDYDYCKGCGICEVECAPRAITMVKEGP